MPVDRFNDVNGQGWERYSEDRGTEHILIQNLYGSFQHSLAKEEMKCTRCGVHEITYINQCTERLLFKMRHMKCEE
jgi:hypothetical protein